MSERYESSAHRPVEARQHSAFRPERGAGAVSLLTVYIVLLFAIPSNVSLGPLGSLGRPALLWGIVLLFTWLLARIQRRSREDDVLAQPVRLMLGLLLTIALVSFAAAMLRGQPADQVSPAFTSLLRLASWTGVVLVAMDGLRTQNAISAVVRRLVIASALLAILGIAQFVTGSTLLDWVQNLPAITVDGGDVDSRGAFTRPRATGTNPLEFAALMAGCLPIAVAVAVSGGYSSTRNHRLVWWLPPILLTLVMVLAVSRSATIGLAVAAATSIPALPRAYRWVVMAAGGAVLLAAVVAVPGLFATIVGLFAGASDDPSTQSRTNALSQVPDFLAVSPIVGGGFGTFLSRYYIFDNQWILILVELGVLGVIALASLVLAGVWSAFDARRRSTFEDTRATGQALAAAIITTAVLFLFFDGLSFPISAGFFFLILGLAAALRRVAVADEANAVFPSVFERVLEDDGAEAAGIHPPSNAADSR